MTTPETHADETPKPRKVKIGNATVTVLPPGEGTMVAINLRYERVAGNPSPEAQLNAGTKMINDMLAHLVPDPDDQEAIVDELGAGRVAPDELARLLLGFDEHVPGNREERRAEQRRVTASAQPATNHHRRRRR